jgi:hypothetical protein
MSAGYPSRKGVVKDATDNERQAEGRCDHGSDGWN